MPYRIVQTELTTKDKEIVEMYNEIANANNDLEEMRDTLVKCSTGLVITPIIESPKGNSFCTSKNGEHFIYEVKYFDSITEELFDVLKPYNQN